MLQISLHWCIITLKYIIILGQLSVHQKHDGEMPMHILVLKRCIKRHRNYNGRSQLSNDLEMRIDASLALLDATVKSIKFFNCKIERCRP